MNLEMQDDIDRRDRILWASVLKMHLFDSRREIGELWLDVQKSVSHRVVWFFFFF